MLMFTHNVFHLFSTTTGNQSKYYALIGTAALFNCVYALTALTGSC